MTQVQIHGFAFEKWVKETFFEPLDASYTQKWDVPAEHNCRNEIPPRLQNLPVSIKTARFGSPIGFGDAVRQFGIEEDFLLIVGFWKQQKSVKNFIAAEGIKISVSSWKELWSPITNEDLKRLDEAIKNTDEPYQTVRERAKAMKKSAPYNRLVAQLR